MMLPCCEGGNTGQQQLPPRLLGCSQTCGFAAPLLLLSAGYKPLANQQDMKYTPLKPGAQVKPGLGTTAESCWSKQLELGLCWGFEGFSTACQSQPKACHSAPRSTLDQCLPPVQAP